MDYNMKMALLSIFFFSYGILLAQNTSNSMLVNGAKTINELIIPVAQKATLSSFSPIKNKTTIIIDKEFSSIHLKVVDAIGETMLARLEVEGTAYTFDLSAIPKGAYYILITIDGQMEAVPIVKE